MKSSLEEYCRTLDEQAAQFAREEVHSEQEDHLQAFNFGRMTQRVANVRRDACLSVGCLLAGLVLGTALGNAIPNGTVNALPHRFLTRANHLIQRAKSTLRVSTLGE